MAKTVKKAVRKREENARTLKKARHISNPPLTIP